MGQVGVPIERDTLEAANELFHQKITICASIATSFDKVGDVLFWIAFSVEQLEFWRFLSKRHFEAIESFCVGLNVMLIVLRSFTKLHLDGVRNHVMHVFFSERTVLSSTVVPVRSCSTVFTSVIMLRRLRMFLQLLGQRCNLFGFLFILLLEFLEHCFHLSELFLKN
ncbi:hypothetical protein RND81_07G089200 [Saponaria officinalis]|uniref:Uncharacterized protein n=1 Tax=Saponaria officinalis TaxID=3572 RepID=A0AAW1JT98_SAPOF